MGGKRVRVMCGEKGVGYGWGKGVELWVGKRGRVKGVKREG